MRSARPAAAHSVPERCQALFDEHLPAIMRLRLDDLVRETPLQKMDRLSGRLERDILLKREDLQAVHSFKLRGAYAKLLELDDDERRRGVICASAGNHSQGVGLAARHLGISALVVMPEITPDIKIEAVRALGAEVRIEGRDFDDACQHALEISRRSGRTFIHPYDDPTVIRGQATLALELLRQADRTPDFLFLPVGGGGLAAGAGLACKFLAPEIQVIGVEAEESPSLTRALLAGSPVPLTEVGHFAEGVAVREVGHHSFGICARVLDEVITVSNDEICAAIQEIYEDTRAIAEPAGAVALAGLRRFFAERPGVEGSAAAVLSGANINFARLRHIVERASIGEESEALLGVTIPERPGSFLSFCECLGRRTITEFNYRYADPDRANVFAGVALRHGPDDKRAIIRSLRNAGFDVSDFSEDDTARQHVRHMVGGRASVDDERLVRFEFPERPGALLDFLRGMQVHWNVSLFHYRNDGSEYGRVLMGIQVPESQEADFRRFLKSSGFRHETVGHHPACEGFLGTGAKLKRSAATGREP